jgi:hypothetical protein
MSQGNAMIEQTLENLKGKSAWGLRRTHGSIFFLELGEPLPRTGNKQVHGEWHFLVEMCHWRFETQEAIVVGSEDDQGFIDSAFQRLDLGLLSDINSASPSHDLRLLFSSGIALKTFASTAAPEGEWTEWLLFCPDDNVWVADGNGTLVCKSIHDAMS